MKDARAILELMRLTSPALPVGACSYSRGLEQAVHAGAVGDVESAARWILGAMEHGTAMLDAPVLCRLYGAFAAGDEAAAERWIDFLLASRETRELLAEEQQMGRALARLLSDLGLPAASRYTRSERASFCAMFALAAVTRGVPLASAACGYLWTYGEAMVSAAIRLIPLEQTDGQRILDRIIDAVPDLAERARALEDEEIGGVATRAAIASALHESQYARLFRS